MRRTRTRQARGKHINQFLKRAAREAHEGDIFIPVLGPAGPGKSTFINNILGSHAEKRAKVSSGLFSCTTKCDLYTLDVPARRSSEYASLGGKKLILVDTPGFDDCRMSDWEVVTEIGNSLHYLYKKRISVGGVIYMLPIFPGRKTASQDDNLTYFQGLYGKNEFANVVLATTMWNLCDLQTGARREEELLRTMWGDMVDQNAMVVRLSNTEVSAWEVMDKVIHRFTEAKKRIRFSDLGDIGDRMRTSKRHRETPGWFGAGLTRWFRMVFSRN